MDCLYKKNVYCQYNGGSKISRNSFEFQIKFSETSGSNFQR